MSRYPKYLTPLEDLIMEYCISVTSNKTQKAAPRQREILMHLNNHLGGFESHHRIAETMEVVKMVIPKT
jgi:hypothetical protein